MRYSETSGIRIRDVLYWLISSSCFWILSAAVPILATLCKSVTRSIHQQRHTPSLANAEILSSSYLLLEDCQFLICVSIIHFSADLPEVNYFQSHPSMIRNKHVLFSSNDKGIWGFCSNFQFLDSFQTLQALSICYLLSNLFDFCCCKYCVVTISCKFFILFVVCKWYS